MSDDETRQEYLDRIKGENVELLLGAHKIIECNHDMVKRLLLREFDAPSEEHADAMTNLCELLLLRVAKHLVQGSVREVGTGTMQ
jgi:bacterioferritin (cytochrome b1)